MHNSLVTFRFVTTLALRRDVAHPSRMVRSSAGCCTLHTLHRPQARERVIRVLSFGPFEIRVAERTVLVGGAPVALGARAFDVLLALAQRHDRVVSKAELMDLAWPGVVVEENN